MERNLGGLGWTVMSPGEAPEDENQVGQLALKTKSSQTPEGACAGIWQFRHLERDLFSLSCRLSTLSIFPTTAALVSLDSRRPGLDLRLGAPKLSGLQHSYSQEEPRLRCPEDGVGV